MQARDLTDRRPGAAVLADSGSRPSDLRRITTKVPELTVYFWIVKVLTTGMGETASDFLTHTLDPTIAVGIGGIALVAALTLQFAVKRYIAAVYWLAAAMVSVFGTMAADALHVGLGISYLASTVFFLVALAVIFVVWQRTEKTLSVHSVYTRRREAFYWATVLATFALGTAAGDLTANTFNLGYLASGVMFAVVIAVPAVGHRRFGLNAIVAFWFAYIITRPLGASFADWAAVPPSRGGLDLGTGPVTAVMTVVIVALVGYLTITRRDESAEIVTDR
jgi:uncharacterized membrane-anchored protein